MVRRQWRGVREGERGPGIVHRGLRHIHLKSSTLSLLTDTLNDGPRDPQQYGTDLFMGTSAVRFWATAAAPLSFSDTCTSVKDVLGGRRGAGGGHKGYAQLSLSPHSAGQANFKAFICAKPLINSAHAASLCLPLLKYRVL